MRTDIPPEESSDPQGPLASGLWSGLRFGLGAGLLGALIIVLVCLGGAFLLATVFGLDLSQPASRAPAVELSVEGDGCQVTRSELETEPVPELRWIVINLDGDLVDTQPAGEDLSFRYPEYGVFEIMLQANVDGEFENISNGVRVFCEPEDQE